MRKVSCIIHIRDGQIMNKSAVKKMFDELTDGRYLATVESKNKRSLPQNAYYWMILTDYIQPALYDLGWRSIKTKDDAHFFVADMFLKQKVVNEETGEVKERIKSTTELSTMEFNVYLSEIIEWAAEYLSISIPEPNSQLCLI